MYSIAKEFPVYQAKSLKVNGPSIFDIHEFKNLSIEPWMHVAICIDIPAVIVFIWDTREVIAEAYVNQRQLQSIIDYERRAKQYVKAIDNREPLVHSKIQSNRESDLNRLLSAIDSSLKTLNAEQNTGKFEKSAMICKNLVREHGITIPGIVLGKRGSLTGDRQVIFNDYPETIYRYAIDELTKLKTKIQKLIE